MSVTTFTKAGVKAKTPAKLDKKVFGVKTESTDILKLAYRAYLDNDRENLAKTLKRGQVSGGGKKPWRQKGTGRARFGSSRNIIWRGGGVAFGPEGNENYSKKLTTRSKRTALRQALTLAEENLIIIDTFETKGKVSDTVKLMNKIGAKRNILLVVSDNDELVKRATRNVANLKAVQANTINVFDIMNSDTVVMSTKAVEFVTEWLGGDK
ncbi:MAG: 50S ribosomal protein L4 [bacterium]|nr:50S ribosomal protein L4 [bacterium]